MQRVLFVDDEPAVLEGFARVLRREPYETVTAPSGEAALQVLSTGPVDVIVSDQRMPRMSGTELLAHVRMLYPKTARIMLSGEPELSGQPDDQPPAHDIFLMKPVRCDDLRHAIKQAMLLHR